MDSSRLSALRAALIRTGSGELASVSGPGAMARFLGSLFIAGATITLASTLVPQPAGTDVAGLYTMCGIAYAIGAALLVRRDRWSPGVLAASLAAGTTLEKDIAVAAIRAFIQLSYGRSAAEG